MPSRGYRFGVAWIADNDEPAEAMSHLAVRSMHLAAALEGTGWSLRLYELHNRPPAARQHRLELIQGGRTIIGNWNEGNYPWYAFDLREAHPLQPAFPDIENPPEDALLDRSDGGSILQMIAKLAEWLGFMDHAPLPLKLESWFHEFCEDEYDQRRLASQRKAWEQEEARRAERLARSLRRI